MSSVHPIPADEEWMAMLRQIEEPLLFHLVDEDDEWQLPEVFEGRLARDAWWRIFRAVRDAFAAAERHRLLAADGYYELAPLALVEIARADIEVLNRVADECSRPGPAWAVLSWPSCWRAWSRATRSVAAEPVPRGMTCSQSWIRLPRER